MEIVLFLFMNFSRYSRFRFTSLDNFFLFSVKVPETSYKEELYRTYNNMITESQVQAKEREKLCTEHNKLERENQQQFELM